jgi:hypothetical protein
MEGGMKKAGLAEKLSCRLYDGIRFLQEKPDPAINAG